MSDELVSTIKARFDHATQKKLLREKYQSKMTFAYNGGMFEAGPELLTLLTCCKDHAVVQDLYHTPVRIETNVLRELAQERWQEQMNAWLEESEALSRER